MLTDFIFPNSGKRIKALVIYNTPQISERLKLGLKIKEIMLEMQEAAQAKSVDLELSYEPFRRAVKDVILDPSEGNKSKSSKTPDKPTEIPKRKNFGDDVTPESELF